MNEAKVSSGNTCVDRAVNLGGRAITKAAIKNNAKKKIEAEKKKAEQELQNYMQKTTLTTNKEMNYVFALRINSIEQFSLRY